MGNSFSCRRKTAKLRPNTPILQVRVFGLGQSGKQSIVGFLKNGKPCLDRSLDNGNMDMQWITHKNVKMLFWVSEQAIDKEIANETVGVRALIYVVDGSDPSRLPLARDHLHCQLKNANGTPHLLILLNKCDNPSFVFLEEAHDALDLDKVSDRHVRIYACSAATGEGIREGIDWLCSKFYINKGIYISRKDTM